MRAASWSCALVFATSVAWGQEPPAAPVEPASAEPAAQTEPAPAPPDAEVVPTVPVAQAPPPPLPVDGDAAARLEDVVVTATKRAAPVRDIPATIAVLNGEDLERQGIQSIDQIVTLVPGVNLTDDGQGQAKRVTIRGISTDINANFTAGTLFGDVPFSDPFVPKVQLDPNPFDMATVEILKGPQGTLFGGSGLNGMIRYVPEAPQFDGVHLKYFGQYTSYPGNGGTGWSYGAVVNAPFADDRAAVRLMGFRRDAPGFVDDTQSGKRDVNQTAQYGFRGMLAWEMTERWKLSLTGALQHTLQEDVAFTDNFDGRLERGNTARPSPVESSYGLGSLGLQGAFDWGDFISQTSMSQKQFDAFLDASRAAPGGSLPVLAVVGHNDSQALSQEFRIVSAPGDSPWKWLAGAFYFDLDLHDCAEAGAAEGAPVLPPLLPLDSVLATPCPENAAKLAGTLDVGQLLADVRLRETALFGELTRELGQSWELTLGARGYRTQSGGTVSTAGIIYSAQNRGMPGMRDASVTEQGLSPKASIAFAPTRDLRAYFTASRGFRFGGPQLGASTPTTTIPEVYKSDSLWNYELGLRSDWLDRTLRLDASAYRIDWKNPQVAQTSNDSLVTFIDNVGGVKGHGVDTSLRYLPSFLQGLSLDVSASWNKTRTTEPFKAASGNTVPAGSPWPLSPRWQTSATLAYTLPLDSWLVGASLRHAYLGRACNTIECTGQQFGYRTLDASVSAAPVGDSYWPELSVSLANLADARGYSNVTSSALLGDSVSYVAPRTLIVRLGGHF
jgi:iron complex outermembrane receptor protein